jgi:hypothetical protein
MAIFPMEIRPRTTYTSGNSGSVFIHGLFFGHDAESGGWQTGTRGPLHTPRSLSSIQSAPAWYRTP